MRNSLYKAALRDWCNDLSASSQIPEAHIEKLKNMFVGPTCVATMDDPSIDAVDMLGTSQCLMI